MLHLLTFVYFAGVLALSAAVIVRTWAEYRDEIVQALGIAPASALAPLPVAARPISRARVIKLTRTGPERRLAA